MRTIFSPFQPNQICDARNRIKHFCFAIFVDKTENRLKRNIIKRSGRIISNFHVFWQIFSFYRWIFAHEKPYQFQVFQFADCVVIRRIANIHYIGGNWLGLNIGFQKTFFVLEF
jgi:hypothetical protein